MKFQQLLKRKPPIALLLGLLVCSLASCGTQHPTEARNAGARENQKAVLKYLQTLKTQPQKRILLGQDLGHGNNILTGYPEHVTKLQQITSHPLGLIGGDYGLDENHDVAATNQVFIEHWKRGGLVTISWHFDNPWTGGDSWDTTGKENLDDLISGDLADRWKMQLDEIADALEPLQTAGVPVLFRPLHEANGDWFWWGRKKTPNHASAYRRLFQNMHDYLTKDRRLDNLLWVYSAAVTQDEGVASYYPGPRYVDVLGIDIYDDLVRAQAIDPNGKVFPESYQGHLDDLITIGHRHGHPVGISEFGRTPASATDGQYNYQRVIAAVRDHQDVVLVYAWHDYDDQGERKLHAITSNLGQIEIMNDPLTATLADINLGATKQ